MQNRHRKNPLRQEKTNIWICIFSSGLGLSWHGLTGKPGIQKQIRDEHPGDWLYRRRKTGNKKGRKTPREVGLVSVRAGQTPRETRAGCFKLLAAAELIYILAPDPVISRLPISRCTTKKVSKRPYLQVTTHRLVILSDCDFRSSDRRRSCRGGDPGFTLGFNKRGAGINGAAAFCYW